jgi:tetratricopeptide (TPR) repeat protein
MSDIDTSSTQPTLAVKPKRRIWRAILIGVLGFIIIVGLGAAGGYKSGVGLRLSAQTQVVSQQLTEQYALALVDINSGNYSAAEQRLNYIISHDPTFPGAVESLAQVMVMLTVPTATTTPTLTPTPDMRGTEALYASAKQFVAAQDWPSALNTLDQLRKNDPTYKTSEVDGMYYFTLRNYGVALISQGNLEGGIYELTLAERFGPLDSTANGLREGARNYLIGASFWELDWKEVVNYFSQIASGWPNMWDGTMTAAERYRIGLMRYGDQLYNQKNYCAAYEQYSSAMAYGNLDDQANKNSNQAYQACYPPTATPEPVVVPTEETPTTDPGTGTDTGTTTP